MQCGRKKEPNERPTDRPSVRSNERFNALMYAMSCVYQQLRKTHIHNRYDRVKCKRSNRSLNRIIRMNKSKRTVLPACTRVRFMNVNERDKAKNVSLPLEAHMSVAGATCYGW